MVSKAALPRMGLGMAALGRPGYINLDRTANLGSERNVEMMQRQANAVMDCLFSLTDEVWLDCARSYGLSEKFVGEYLRAKNVRPQGVYVSSKWGYSKLRMLQLTRWQTFLTYVCFSRSLCCRLERGTGRW